MDITLTEAPDVLGFPKAGQNNYTHTTGNSINDFEMDSTTVSSFQLNESPNKKFKYFF